MMLPKVIIHNSVTLDGSLTGFMPHMGLHYRIAGEYQPEVHLIGSNTIRSGIDMFGEEVPPEDNTDFIKPERGPGIPFWVIIDTKGSLKGLLHTCRRFEYCRDVIVLVSGKTPADYLEHLRERHYDYHAVGEDKVDLEKALNLLADQYGVKTVLTDTGRILANLLINKGLADEISLLVHPLIAGEKCYNMFSDVRSDTRFELVKCEVLEKNYVWMVYKTLK